MAQTNHTGAIKKAKPFPKRNISSRDKWKRKKGEEEHIIVVVSFRPPGRLIYSSKLGVL